jgi:hypothetical protein
MALKQFGAGAENKVMAPRNLMVSGMQQLQ